MNNFKSDQSLQDFQLLIHNVYGVTDDRDYSTWDLCSHVERYSLRAVKGIRKEQIDKIRLNLLVAMSWAMSFGNRFHIEVDEEVWKHFPYLCTYCGDTPCQCKALKSSGRKNVVVNELKRPKTLKECQKMFELIYPSASRNLVDAGIHLAEEVGEIVEAVQIYLGEHKVEDMKQISLELADYFSCIFAVANSAGIDIADELEKMYANGCPICKHLVCECTFSTTTHHLS